MDRRYLKYLRPLVQAGFTLFALYIGYRFYLFYEWAMGKSNVYSPRPPGVEAFLPISALLGLKRWFLTGQYDMIHPAGLTVLLAIVIISFFFRKGFCGWICPVGFISNVVERVGQSLGASIRIKRGLGAVISLPKYALMLFFLYVIFYKMDLRAIEGFITSPYNIAVDAKMLKFFLSPSTTTIAVIGGLVVASLFLKNFWCRFLCPYGALLGLLAAIGPSRIKRAEDQCIHCKKCSKVCPAGIAVHKKGAVIDPDCIGCLECVGVCPKEQCLSPAILGHSIQPIYFALMIVAVFVVFWLVAKGAGYWETMVPPQVFKRFYMMMDAFSHPAY